MTATVAENRHVLDRAFLIDAGWLDADRRTLAGDASFRHYDRLQSANGSAVISAVMMDAPPPREDVRPFVAIAKWLVAQGFSAPSILAQDLDNGFLLLEDLGDDRYSRIIPRAPACEEDLYRAAVDTLIALHQKTTPARLVVGTSHYQLPLYDDALYLREVQLLTDWYMPAITGQPIRVADRRQYTQLWQDVLKQVDAADVLVLRDYHADNLMWLPDRDGIARVGLLDFQDAVRGHPAYDLVSLLEDARRDVAPALAEKMLAHYIDATAVDDASFRRAYAILGAQRNAKIIGIFTRLYARDGKSSYLTLISRVWGLLERDLQHPALAALKTWFDDQIPAALRHAVLDPQTVPRLPKQAMVLAAGLGLRMRPLTDHTPKPLIAVGGRPMLDRILDHLGDAGVDRAVVNIHHLPDQIKTYAASRAGRLPDITVSDETDQLLESGGGVVKALPLFDDKPVFVLNGDMAWRDGDGGHTLQRLAMGWSPATMSGLLLVIRRDQALGYDGPGDFFLEPDGRLRRRGAAAAAPYVFTGIQILDPKLFAGLAAEPFSLNRIYDAALADGRLFGAVHDGAWVHVGTPDAVALADAHLR